MPATTPPDFGDARDHVLGQVVWFARTLRADGATVPATASLAATAALVEVGLDDRTRVRAAMHATLIADRRDRDAFEEHFPTFWYRLRSGLEAAVTDDVGERSEDDAGRRDGTAPGGDIERADDGRHAGTEAGDGFAAIEAATPDGANVAPGTTDRPAAQRLAENAPDGEAGGGEETARMGTYAAAGPGDPIEDAPDRTGLDRATLDRFASALATLPGRRWTRTPDGRWVDARRALRRSLSTGGVAMSLPRHDRDVRAVGVTVLVDVSRSVLDAVDRGFLLAVLDGLASEGRSVRTFFFDTDIREVTDAFARPAASPAAALERAEVAWGGGTRIGDSLSTLRERWPDAVDRRTVTLVISDGLDVGDIDRLERAMAWLAGRSGAVVWLNPLAVSTDYRPTCRGMAAALPYVDGLFAFGSDADLAEAARQLQRHGPYGPVGYEHDFRDRGRPQGGSSA